MTQEVLTHLSDGVFTIQMNRPEKKNALTQNMYQLIAEAMNTADAEDAAHVLVLRGTSGLFTAGNDISDFRARSTGQADSAPFATAAFFEAVLALRKPLIAAVEGFAIGIGCTMLLHCDLVYAAQSAYFSLPFVNLGLCPEFGSSFVLPKLAGHQRAAELFLLGDRFTPEHAKQVGIVNQIFDDDRFMDEVMVIAKQLAAKSPAALMATKKLMRSASSQAVREAINTDGEMFAKLLTGPEAREAFIAFAEKRAPDFSKL